MKIKQKAQRTFIVFCAYNRVILSRYKTKLPYLWEKISYFLSRESAIIVLGKNILIYKEAYIMNKLGIFMNFWEKNWDADHAKYIRKAKEIGFDVLEFQAQPLLEMSDDKIRSLNKNLLIFLLNPIHQFSQLLNIILKYQNHF